MSQMRPICSLAALVFLGACNHDTGAAAKDSASDPLKTDLALAALAQPYQAQRMQPIVEAPMTATSDSTTPIASASPSDGETVPLPRRATSARPTTSRAVSSRSPSRRASSPRSAGSHSDTSPRESTAGAEAIDRTPVAARTTHATSNGAVGDGMSDTSHENTSEISNGSSSGSRNAGEYGHPAEPVPARAGRHTVRDAAIGAGAGAVLGAVIGRDRSRGALIGATAGAILGGIYGNNSGTWQH